MSRLTDQRYEIGCGAPQPIQSLQDIIDYMTNPGVARISIEICLKSSYEIWKRQFGKGAFRIDCWKDLNRQGLGK
jgi:hypothetical protein